jgi:hypothetical protein
MENSLFDTFIPLLKTLSSAQLEAEIANPQKLRLAESDHRGKQIEVAYAPFDHINTQAKIVLVGLTPGRKQMGNALRAAQKALQSGAGADQAKSQAKVFASFSGPMRRNLVDLLDGIGVQQWLGLESTTQLWEERADLVHFTSALRYPVFIDGENYSGAPNMLTTPILQEQLQQWFATEMESLTEAIFIPLGPKVSKAVEHVAQKMGMDSNRILSGLPHPSGANAERIAYFLGRKPRQELSVKTNPESLDAARRELKNKLQTLGGSEDE